MDKETSEANRAIPQAQVKGGPEDCNALKSMLQVCRTKLSACIFQTKKVIRKEQTAQVFFQFTRLPDELQLKIISFALEDWKRQRITISRPPAMLSDELEYLSAGLYCRPHPFLAVSIKFRQMAMMGTSSMKPSFAVSCNGGGELAPPRALCNRQKDALVFFQSVLDYGPHYIIRDLMRVKTLYVLCRCTLSEAAIRLICELPVDTRIIFIHEYLYRNRIFPATGFYSYDPLRSGSVLSYQEHIIYDDLLVQTAFYQQSHNLDGLPQCRWYTPTRNSVSRIMKIVKDSVKIKLATTRHKKLLRIEAAQRAHWVKTGHWTSNVTRCEKDPYKCKGKAAGRNPMWGI